MYVCMYRGRPSWRCPWKGAVQLGQGEGPIGIVATKNQVSKKLVQTRKLHLEKNEDDFF